MKSYGADEGSRELAWYALRVVLAVGIAIGMVSVLALLWLAADVLLLGFAGVLLAILLRGLANFLARHSPLTAGWSLPAVILLLGTVFALALWFSASTVLHQFDTLATVLPLTAKALEMQLLRFEWGQWLVEQAQAIDWGSRRIDVIGRTTGAISSVFGSLVNLVIIGFLGLYLAIQPHVYLAGLLHLTPVPLRRRMKEVLFEITRTLHAWLLGITASMTAVGVLSGVGLWLMGIPFALSLGLIAALLAFIPYLGPVLSVIPAMLVAVIRGPEYALYVASLYLGIQLVESYFLSPMIQQYAVSVPAAMLLFGQIMLGILLGGIGVVLAAPIVATVAVVVKMLYVEDLLQGGSTEDRSQAG